MTVRLARWSLDFYALPYRREIVWANAVEREGIFALLTLTGDNGATGFAEGTLKATWSGVSPRSLKAAFEDFLVPRLKSVDIASPEAVAQALAGVPENRLARGMIDSAAWMLDAAGRGEPLWQRWGGTREVDLTWAITRQPPAAMAAEAEAVCAQYGFRTLKVKGGQGFDTDRAAMRAVRTAVGDGVVLYVDANSAYTREEAADYVRLIADEGAVVAEDPSPLLPDERFAELQAASSLPVLVDRHCSSVADARAFLDRGATALSTKPGRIGLSEARAINDLAATRGARVAIGLYAESLAGTLVSLQQAAALPAAQCLVAAEQTFFLEMADQIVTLDTPLRDGRIALPESADLASLIDHDKLARYALDVQA
jgi:L-alanine-DL-glutamate epimerase-like enolase superfamily enzyme